MGNDWLLAKIYPYIKSNISGSLSNSSLRKLSKSTSSGNISGNFSNSGPRRLGKGNNFGYREAGGGPRSGGFNYFRFGYSGGLSGPNSPNNPGGPSGPSSFGGPGGPNSPGGPSGPNNFIFYKNLERFKREY
ncbi:hypothetical protein QBC45DRAFT_429341 [Copromyces sp. CBS 386.78]|nr:hypothetical protein QBC45DRAFT_429341 [Copromyces sp. CBS 386.78]